MTYEEKYDLLYCWMKRNGLPMPIEIEPYTEEEQKLRDSMPPAFWTLREWQHFYNNHCY